MILIDFYTLHTLYLGAGWFHPDGLGDPRDTCDSDCKTGWCFKRHRQDQAVSNYIPAEVRSTTQAIN